MKPWRLVSDETAAPGRKEPLILKISTIAPGQSISEHRLLPILGVRPSSVQEHIILTISIHSKAKHYFSAPQSPSTLCKIHFKKKMFLVQMFEKHTKIQK